MGKRSTNLNRWRKAGSSEAIADLMQFYGITSADLREWIEKNKEINSLGERARDQEKPKDPTSPVGEGG